VRGLPSDRGAAYTSPPPGTRIAWSKGGTAGLVALTLDGARDGGTATGITWQFQDVTGPFCGPAAWPADRRTRLRTLATPGARC